MMKKLKKHIVLSLLVFVMMPFASFAQTSFNITINATDAKCNGNANGSATVTVNNPGSSTYTYSWNTNPVQTGARATNLQAGTYKVLVTDNNNVSITDSITINQPQSLNVVIDSIVVQPCFLVTTGGGACGCSNKVWAVVNGGTAPYRYFWTPQGQTTDSLINVCYILFGVTVTDTNNCTATDSLSVVIPPLPDESGIATSNNISYMKLFPVPASNQLNINLSEPAMQSHIEIYDVLGNKVLEQKVNDGAILVALDISSLAGGNYLFRVAGVNGQKISKFSKSNK